MKDERKEALIRKYSYAAQQAQAKEGKGPGGPGPGTRAGQGPYAGRETKGYGENNKKAAFLYPGRQI